jgi:CTP-dependent riboflavin kinase
MLVMIGTLPPRALDPDESNHDPSARSSTGHVLAKISDQSEAMRTSTAPSRTRMPVSAIDDRCPAHASAALRSYTLAVGVQSLIGEVLKGKGEAKRFIDEGVIGAAIGVTLYAGTINVRLTDPDGRHRRLFQPPQMIAADQLRSRRRLELCECALSGTRAWIIAAWPSPEGDPKAVHTTFEVVAEHFVPNVSVGGTVVLEWDPHALRSLPVR